MIYRVQRRRCDCQIFMIHLSRSIGYRGENMVLEISANEDAVRHMRQTIQRLADHHGESEVSMLQRLTKPVIKDLTYMIERLAEMGATLAIPEFARLTALRDRYIEEPEFFVRHRQHSIEEEYRDLMQTFKALLARSEGTLSMLTIQHIETIERDLQLSPEGSMADRVARVADRVQIFSPMIGDAGLGGFAAEASGLGHMIKLYFGILDCVDYTSQLICQYAIDENEEGDPLIRRMLTFPVECDRAVEQVKELIDLAIGARIAVSFTIPRTLLQDRVAGVMSRGAKMFVVFHELAHILLPSSSAAHDEEYACDAFAARLIVASDSPLIICGMYMALELMSAVSHRVSGDHSSESHPPCSSRSNRVTTIVQSSGIALWPWSELLAIPRRLRDEQIAGETF